MGTTASFIEFQESTTDISSLGFGRIRMFGGVLQKSLDGAAWSDFITGGGAGTVTSVGATVNGLLVIGGTPTITPTVGIAAIASHTVIGNATGGSAVPTATAVTLPMMATLSASVLMGNPTGSPAAPAEITLGAGLSFVGTTIVSTGTGAPTDATYITQTPNGTLSNEQALSVLASGPMFSTTTTGVVTTLTTLTGLTSTSTALTVNLTTGKAGGQSAIGGTVTTENLTLRPNAADTTTGRIIVQGIGVEVPNGTAASPSISGATTNTGWSPTSSSTWQFSSGGTFAVAVGANGVNTLSNNASTGFYVGSSGTSGYLYDGSSGLRLYANGAVRVAISSAGVVAIEGLTTNGFVKTSGGTGTLSVDTTSYQPTLTAGTNITIIGNTISASGGGGSGATALTGAVTGSIVATTIDTTFGGKAGGQTVIGGTVTTENLTVRPNAADTSTGRTIFQGLGVEIPDGTAAAPALRFTTETNNGFYRFNSTTIGVSLGGVVTYYMATGGQLEMDGGAGAGIAIGNAGGSAITGFVGHNVANTGVSIAAAASSASNTAAAVRMDVLAAGGVRFPNVTYVSFTDSSTPIASTAPTVMEFGIAPAAIASGASVTLDAYKWRATTVTFTGTTSITTGSGVNFVDIERPTYTDASALTITNAATMVIKGTPIAAGSVTITNAYAAWVQQGAIRLDGFIASTEQPSIVFAAAGQSQAISKTGGTLTVGTTDANVLAFMTNHSQVAYFDTAGSLIPVSSFGTSLGDSSHGWNTVWTEFVQGIGASGLRIADNASVNTALSFSSSSISVQGNVIPNVHNTYDLGSSANAWKNVWAEFVQSKDASNCVLFSQDSASAGTGGLAAIEGFKGSNFTVLVSADAQHNIVQLGGPAVVPSNVVIGNTTATQPVSGASGAIIIAAVSTAPTSAPAISAAILYVDGATGSLKCRTNTATYTLAL